MKQRSIVSRVKSAMRGLPWPFSGGGGFSGGGRGSYRMPGMSLPGTDIDYETEAGDLWANTIVAAALRWITDAFMEAPLCLVRMGTDGEEKIITDHPFLSLVSNPNPWMTGRNAWKPVLTDYHTDGNAYLYKERNAAGRVVRLRWIPRFALYPEFPPDGSEFISNYRYTMDSGWTSIPVEDIIHLRNGIDPYNLRLGLAPLKSGLRELCTDNYAATYSAATVKSPAPSGIISPDTGTDYVAPIEEDEKDGLKKDIRDKTTLTRSGDILVFDTPMKWQVLGFNPKDMDIASLRALPEQRLLALLGLTGDVVNFRAGNTSTPGLSNSGGNVDAATKSAWEQNIIPTHSLFAEELQQQLLWPDFPNTDGLTVRFDRSNVQALQDDFDALAKRAVTLYAGGLFTRTEGRKLAGVGEDVNDAERDSYVAKATAPGPEPPVAPATPAGKALAGDKVLASFLKGWTLQEGGQ